MSLTDHLSDIVEDNGIKHVVASKFVEVLTEACLTSVPETDDTRVDKVGLRSVALTGRERVVLVIRHMDPIKEEAAGDSTRGAVGEVTSVFKGWPDAISGGQYFEVIRGVIELRADFSRSRETTDQADHVVQLVLARAKSAILKHANEFGGGRLVDAYGEQCVLIRLMGGTEYDSGEGTSNVSRYFLRWAALTLTAQH